MGKSAVWIVTLSKLLDISAHFCFILRMFLSLFGKVLTSIIFVVIIVVVLVCMVLLNLVQRFVELGILRRITSMMRLAIWIELFSI